jgi:hypothetical protein
MKRKKPLARVLSMNGDELPPDRISRADFLECLEAQETVLLAQGHERKVLGRLRVRIERGAQIDDCEYHFDARLGIVRRRGIAVAAGKMPPSSEKRPAAATSEAEQGESS